MYQAERYRWLELRQKLEHLRSRAEKAEMESLRKGYTVSEARRIAVETKYDKFYWDRIK